MNQFKLGAFISSLFILSVGMSSICFADELVKDTTLDITMDSALGDLKGEFKLDESLIIKTGSLATKAVSPITFGEMNSSGEIVTKLNTEVPVYFPASSPLEALGVEVHDLRGNGKGWILKAMLVDFKNEEGNTLTNFKLTIPTEHVITKSATNENIPDSNSVVFQGYGVESESIVMNANEGKGMGKFTNIFKSKNKQSKDMSLFIPLTAHKGLYNGTILWSLDDVPS
ncbi:WxL domain-containing protein [Vagococcus fluvialis]|uniref:WxL domain-containing protein n=1 Tax=Vagococcus fluvialis TaxID=2738 RepID=UPI001A8F195F|nr:WxL domain-containing protein [Vagococcus fluvialis]MBO0437450.1 WxL domain-containing protein [Vagococcus fluvialis]